MKRSKRGTDAIVQWGRFTDPFQMIESLRFNAGLPRGRTAHSDPATTDLFRRMRLALAGIFRLGRAEGRHNHVPWEFEPQLASAADRIDGDTFSGRDLSQWVERCLFTPLTSAAEIARRLHYLSSADVTEPGAWVRPLLHLRAGVFAGGAMAVAFLSQSVYDGERRVRDWPAAANVIRDVFRWPNPNPPAWCRPEWRTDTVCTLANQMWEARDFSAAPILADALQDAGCGYNEALWHLRDQTAHVRGCWVLDEIRRGSATGEGSP